MLDDILKTYIQNTEDPVINYTLARMYDDVGQTGAAISFYLRCAERTEDNLRAYDCLIRIGHCFEKQGNRNYTVKAMYNSAIALMPNRPEAYYFLSRKLEWEHQYFESYTTANIGLTFANDEPSDVGNYLGSWSLIFQKAIAAWHRGRGMESRKLLQVLVNEHWNKMDETHKSCVERNILSLGSGPKEHAFVPYDSNKLEKLRFNFPGADRVKKNHSQVLQDMFIISMLNGKRNGTFIEIGGGDPFWGNNTALLETEFDWRGVSVEYDKNLADSYKAQRKSKIYNEDALKIDYKQFIKDNFGDVSTIDYLQLDIEPARNTYDCMLKMPFDEVKFAVITYEHDYYADVTRIYRDKSRKFLKSKGYVLVVNDISPDGTCNFEDWWVHPDLVNEEILSIMTDNDDKIKDIRDYFFNPKKKFYEWYRTDQYVRETFYPDLEYKGVVVEVGAGPPESLSMSKHFRDSGWRSICVEPNPKFVEQHKAVGSEVYEYACSFDEGQVPFTINYNNDHYLTPDNDGTSFSALSIRYGNLPEHNTQETIIVNKIRLNTLLENLNVDKIDVLSIDVEGWELEVLAGFDAAKYSPKIIVVENLENNPEYEATLNRKGYEKNKTLGCNEVYLRRETVNMFAINSSFAKRAFIVDNFYADPMAVRNFAKNVEFFDGGIGRGFIGKRSSHQYLFPGLKETFENIMGKRITKWEEHGMNGRFQLNIAGEPIVYHCDDQDYAAMIYLTPDAPSSCGTSTFRHRKTKIFHKTDPNIRDAFTYKTFLDATPYEKVDQFGNLFNRLVIFDAGCIHAANEYFGFDMEDARLWHMFFFDAV